MRTVTLWLAGLLLGGVAVVLADDTAEDGSCLRASQEAPRSGQHLVYLKREHRLCFLDGARTLWSSPASHGARAGKKRFEGDGKTPEGSYTVHPARPSQRFGTFMHISYPGPDDVRHARQHGRRPGGAIGVHGPQVWYAFLGTWQAAVDHSDGCIVLDRKGIAELAALVREPMPMDILR